jgi:hypothetical protein
MTWQRFSCFLGVFLLASVLALSAGAGKRILITPLYVPGETFRYRIESRTSTSGKIITPILNPEGATASVVSIHLQIRLDVLIPPSIESHSTPRLRATYEKSSADSESDAFDPAHPSPSAQYARLEGRSLEFTLDANGHVAGLKGIKDILQDRAAERSALSWFGEVSSSSTFPVGGVEVGQKWKNERPVDGAPLSDLILRGESTYLRDEPCSADTGRAARLAPRAPTLDTCAVILTRFTILRRGSPRSEATPNDYRRNGLRVSGSWNGSGESLDSISRLTGFLVRSTQTSDQQMDYEIASAATGSKIHNQSHIQAHSEITLLSTASAAAESK